MSTQPAVSVVMSVYNGAEMLGATLDSILAQRDVDFEVIVVNDGSTDETARILDATAGIKVIHQTNQGLTRALITGCRAAHAPLIARHDCGDRSHRERLRKQIDAISSGDDIVLVSCSTEFVGPQSEPLYVVSSAGEEVRRSLLHDGVDTIRGLTHHGSAMFRRETYERAGGYREAFRYAQDLDLWIRMAKLGRIEVIGEVLYEASYVTGAISASRRREQTDLAKIAIAIRDGGDERELLEQARTISEANGESSSDDATRSLYFIASCLRRNGDMRYKRYVREALRRNPLHLRSWLLLMR